MTTIMKKVHMTKIIYWQMFSLHKLLGATKVKR